MTVKRLGQILLGTALIVSSVAVSAANKVHEVKKGDNLWDLAAKYHTTPQAIAKANGISEKANLSLGKKLRIPATEAEQKADRAKQAAERRKPIHAEAAKKTVTAKSTAPSSTAPAAKSSSHSFGDSVAQEALRHVGCRYTDAGTSRDRGFDCSGLTSFVYAKFGIGLPHNSASQSGCGTPVSRNELKSGDLLFFSRGGRSIGHVGIYIGNNKFVHAANHKKGVIISSLSEQYYASNYRCARRVK